MRAIRLNFLHMLKLIRRDMMLVAACLAPLFAGAAIKFLIPVLEKSLTRWLNTDAVLTPYYGLFDIFYASISPVMFCFISAMVILEEHDDHVDSYLFVTGLGQNGYILSRIFAPALCAFFVTAALLPVFRLTDLSVSMVFFLSLAGTMQGIIIALLIVTLSSNKLEGMAVSKLSTLLILGAIVPYFVPGPVCYIFSVIPSFWIGEAVINSEVLLMLPAILTAGAWIFVLLHRGSKANSNR